MSIFKFIMKSIIVAFFLFSSFLAVGQSSGIDFSSGKWKEIVKRAKEENKLIFFDAYTSWCGPCIKMQNSVFPDSILGAFYNQHFINVKYDMEKGEGVNLGQKFAVQVYPTLLFIDPRTEKVINHSIGFKNVSQLLLLGEQSVSKVDM